MQWTQDKTKARLEWACMVDDLIQEAAEIKAKKMTKQLREECEVLKQLYIESTRIKKNDY
jgi:hypothetical protein